MEGGPLHVGEQGDKHQYGQDADGNPVSLQNSLTGPGGIGLPALAMMENFVSKSNKAFLIISHDREFLDRVVSKIRNFVWI